MVRILDFLNSHPYQLGFRKNLATTTGKRSMDGTQFIAAESHGILLMAERNQTAVGGDHGRRESLRSGGLPERPAERQINVEFG